MTDTPTPSSPYGPTPAGGAPPHAPGAIAAPPQILRTSPARVRFNDRTLAGARTGIGTYTAQVLAHWPNHVPPRGALLGSLPGVRDRAREEPVRLPSVRDLRPIRFDRLDTLAARRAVGRWRAGAESVFRGASLRAYSGLIRLAVRHADLYWEPDHIPRGRARRVVTTVHDLSPLERPDDHPAHRVRYWSRLFDERLHWSDAFIAVSGATARTLSARLEARGLDTAKINVIPLGPRWATPPSDWTPETVRHAIGLPEQCVVCLGTLEPRKNHLVLLDALGAMSEAERARHTLVFVGRPGWGGEAFWGKLSRHPMAPRVLVTGHIRDAEAAGVVFASRGLVLPSHDEGFGLPLLEAMRLGVPTAVSTAEALREVSAGSALELDPADAGAWADALRTLTASEPERERLIALGRTRARAFGWSRCAEAHAALFESLLG